MITYEYKCTECDHEFEKMMTVSQYGKDIHCTECEAIAERHFRTAPSLDTYFPGSTKDQHPVHGI